MNIKCKGCGGEWFLVERWVTIADESFPAGGVPRYTNGKPMHFCRDCGEPFDMTRLERKPFELALVPAGEGGITLSASPHCRDDTESYGPA